MNTNEPISGLEPTNRLDFLLGQADTSSNCSPSDKPQGLRRGYFLRSAIFAVSTGWEVSHAG